MTKAHVQRPPLPWQTTTDHLTLCGRAIHPSMTLLPADHRFPSRHHQPPSGTCTTCWDRIGYVPTWDTDPLLLLETWITTGSDTRRARLARQLHAIGRITQHHPDLLDSELALDALAL